MGLRGRRPSWDIRQSESEAGSARILNRTEFVTLILSDEININQFM